MAFLELRGVSRSYPSGSERVHALREVDLNIERGEFVAVVGESGGGKTTLLSILGGLDVPSSGRYLVDGEEVPQRECAALAELRARTFGFIFQGFHLLEQRPAIDSVGLGLRYQGVRGARRCDRSQAAAQRVGMASRLAQRTVTLSGGQRQRLAIARAIATDSPVILADEPTGNLDSVTGAAVMAELTRLNREGTTVIVVTHSAEVAAAASRVVRITDGILSEQVPAKQVPSERTPAPAASPRSLETRNPRHPRHQRLGAARDLLADAAASVLSRLRQSLALAATVGLAVALLVTTIGLTHSTRAQVADTFDAHANREVTASWSADETELDAATALAAATPLAGVDAAAILTGHTETAVGNLRGDGRVVTMHTVVGDLAAATDSSITGTAELAPGEALVGAALAEQLQLGPIAGGPAVVIAGRVHTVRGLIDSSGRMPGLIGEVVVADPDATNPGAPLATPGQRNLVILAEPGAALQIGDQLPAALDPYSPELFSIQVPTDPRTLRAEIEGGVQTSLIAFTAVSALIALLTLMNSIGAAVTARRPELGLRRALGAGSRQLAGLVMTEATLLGCAGGVGGLIAGMLSILAFTIAQRWVPVFDIRLAPAAIAAGIAVGALASLLGALRAARVRPADALRQGA